MLCPLSITGAPRTTSYAEATSTPIDGVHGGSDDKPDTAQPESNTVSSNKTVAETGTAIDAKKGDGQDDDGAQHAKPVAGAPAGPPKPPPFRFFHLLNSVHKRVVALPGYDKALSFVYFREDQCVCVCVCVCVWCVFTRC